MSRSVSIQVTDNVGSRMVFPPALVVVQSGDDKDEENEEENEDNMYSYSTSSSNRPFAHGVSISIPPSSSFGRSSFSSSSLSGDMKAGGGPGRRSTTMGSFFRSITATLFPQFFQTRQDIRYWGEPILVDPSIQPIDPNLTTPPSIFFPSVLPGYSPLSYSRQDEKKKQSPTTTSTTTAAAAGDGHFFENIKQGLDQTRTCLPILSNPKHIIQPTYQPKPNIQKGRTLTSSEQGEHTMSRLPYPHARFKPQDCTTSMYASANPYTAYPYGVPAVEENETVFFWEPFLRTQKKLFCC